MSGGHLLPGTTLRQRTADAVSDDLWDEASRHYDERALAALLVAIGNINVWNRLNAATKQVAGEWLKSAEARQWVENHSTVGR